MLKVFLEQGKRLFSSKQNGGKQVPRLTDRLHAWKQIVLLLSITLLLGYSQFRENFKCDIIQGVDPSLLTNFCWTNGTWTVIESKQRIEQLPLAHTGLGFSTVDGHRMINHNYMKSIWALIILLTALSYFAQRKWAQLFDDVALKALLKLSGSEESRLVRAAESARPYELLSGIKADNLDEEIEKKKKKKESANLNNFSQLRRDEQVISVIDIVDRHFNIYDHNLDYYPNQLAYLLLTKNSTHYKLSCLKLRRKLIMYSLWSTLATLLQFLTPLVFIGHEYLFYGWNYLVAFLHYLVKFTSASDQMADNSVDYELSSRIFPIATACRYQSSGASGALERETVLCTVSINEICSKLFAAIWWLVALSIVVELYSLIMLIMCAMNSRTIGCWYGVRYWPSARAQANLIAGFRFRRAMLMKRRELIKRVRAVQGKSTKTSKLFDVKNLIGNNKKVAGTTLANEKKRLEAEGSHQADCLNASGSIGGRSKDWDLWCVRDICNSLTSSSARLVCCRANLRRENLEQEPQLDVNVFYLLYLLYLRLGRSKSKVEQVIIMTERALGNYLADLEAHCEELASLDKVEEEEGENEEFEQSTSGGENISLTAAAKKIQNSIMMC